MRIGGSVFLIALGAILAFAVEVADATVGAVTIDWVVVGYILMASGLAGLIWALMLTERLTGDERVIEERRRTSLD